MLKLNYILLMIIAVFAFSESSVGQTHKKSDLRGTYSKSTGVPTQWFHKEDGSSMEVMGMEYSRTTLQLKWFGRVKIVEEDKRMNFKTVHNGKWRLEGDTISITYNPYGEMITEKYTFREPVYLTSIGGTGGYTKELN